MRNLNDRQHQLHEWLQSQPHISIAEIMEHLQVSTATAYRDTRILIQAGLAEKTARGIKQVQPVELTSYPDKCAFCGGMIQERIYFVIQMQDGTQYRACCPHCGLMSLSREGAVAALAHDFIYGRMINARQATYLVNSAVQICCEPSVLCFASREDAGRFQAGFGGECCSLDEARSRVKALMSLGN